LLWPSRHGERIVSVRCKPKMIPMLKAITSTPGASSRRMPREIDCQRTRLGDGNGRGFYAEFVGYEYLPTPRNTMSRRCGMWKARDCVEEEDREADGSEQSLRATSQTGTRAATAVVNKHPRPTDVASLENMGGYRYGANVYGPNNIPPSNPSFSRRFRPYYHSQSI